MIATPASAQDAVNTSTPLSTTTATPSSAATLTEFDDRGESRSFVERGSARASANRLAITVWGGNDELALETYLAAHDIKESGRSVAIIWAPARFPSDRVAFIEVYAGGGRSAELTYGMDHVSDLRADLADVGIRAYDRMFPR